MSNQQIKVIASKGVKVPYEGRANQYIDDTTVVTVQDSMYYMRRIQDGDLVVFIDDADADLKPDAVADTKLKKNKE